MAKASHTLQKGAVVQHTAKAHNLKDFCDISVCLADENKVGGCAIAVRNDYKNLVEEFGLTSSRCAFLRLRDRGGRKLWIVSAHAPTETAEDNSKDAFCDELNAMMSKIPSQQVIIVGIDANAKMGLEQQYGSNARAGDFNQEKRLRRKLRRLLQQDRDNEWTSRAMEFEKAWEDRNPRKVYALLKQYSGKMKRCSPVLNTANGKMKDGKSGGDNGISAEMLKYRSPSGICEMTKIIRSIWINERTPD
ncbi:hypothetical protein RB195_011261 [Necator americanus]|uniref:Endonuclease/exonuclease/phosphatase domain-containing protein n=1 Tax=Necator americanus TaxID=51031 RepID=A0ABR1D3G0_NECAM